MPYTQITPEERYTLAMLRKQTPRPSAAAMAALLGRHRSTILREFRRNSSPCDSAYRPSVAQEHANGRRSRSRRNTRFSPSDWKLIERLLARLLSPEQISGRLRQEGLLEISHETIYKHIWDDKQRGGHLWLSLRQRLRYRKRYGAMKSVAGSRENGTSPNGPGQPRSATKLVIGRWTRSSVRAISTAW